MHFLTGFQFLNVIDQEEMPYDEITLDGCDGDEDPADEFG